MLLHRETGNLYVHKCLTTPKDPSIGVFKGLEAVMSEYDIPPENLCKIVHGTTLTSNTIIERTGARTGMITTKGFRDVLGIGREGKYDIYDLDIEFAKPLIPRYLIREVEERIRSDRELITTLDLDEGRSMAQELIKENGVVSIAVCLLHSYLNNVHEKRIKEMIITEFPGIYVSISSEISPRIGEYPRFSTTAANAYVQPLVDNYLAKIEDGLKQRSIQGNLYIMTSSGGTITPQTARLYPVLLLESGPAAGVIASNFIGRKIDAGDILSFDMGGTTTKGSIIRDGAPMKRYEFEAARVHRFKEGSGIPLSIPNIELIEFGAGGGSIAQIDERGLIRVGPASAGADPGPACYAMGGENPTITDADLILGYLDPNFFLGGEMILSSALAEKAIAKFIAEPLGLDLTEAAWGIHETANEDIISAFREIAVKKGVDLRDFDLIAFGGAAPTHVCRIARGLGIRRMIVPLRAGVASALGLLVSPMLFDLSQTYKVVLDDLSPETCREIFESMVRRGVSILSDAGYSEEEIRISKRLDMRYLGQGYEIEIEVPDSGLLIEDAEQEKRELRSIFEAEYKGKYSILLEEPIEIVNFKVTVVGPDPKLSLRVATQPVDGAVKGQRDIYFLKHRDFVECPVYDRYRLSTGTIVEGPAVVEERECTCVIEPGFKGQVDELFNLVVW